MKRIIRIKGKKIYAMILVAVIIIATICSYAIYNKVSKADEADIKMEGIKEAFGNKRSEVQSKISNVSIDDVDDEEVVKYIVELEGESVVEIVTEKKSLQEKIKYERQILDGQYSAISKIEAITGTKIEAQLGYLVNAIVIKAKKSDLFRISRIPEVKKMYKSLEYSADEMKSSVDYSLNDYKIISEGIEKETGLNELKSNTEKNYTGQSNLIAVIDTGINYEHQDMKLDEGITSKYNKEEWDIRIKALGYGKYFSQKVPFGYNYVNMDNNVMSKEELHGNPVAGIISQNGELKGVAQNAQIIALKVLRKDTGNTEYIIKAMEDAVKLDADVINMSLSNKSDIAVEDELMAKVVKIISKQGIVTCVSAGNTATIDSTNTATNKFNLVDTATISSPASIEDTLAVASVQVSLENGEIKKRISDYTAWGPTNNIEIKPEITAPGENILALYDGAKGYKTLSGTSMSAPFISGCIALMKNEVKNGYIMALNNEGRLSGKELTSYVKNSLMNTAKPIYDVTNYNINDSVPYSVRIQGAGLVNINSAINNRVVATYNGTAKLEVGEIKGCKKLNVLLTNYGDTDVTYTVDASDVYVPYNRNEGSSYCMVKSGIASIDAKEQVTVPARSTATVEVTICASAIDRTFIEGYVTFRGDGVPTLSMPLLGYAGNWYDEPAVDKSVYYEGISYLEEKQVKHPANNMQLKSQTCLVANNTNWSDNVLGLVDGDGKGNNTYNGELNAFSPNKDGVADEVYPGITQLRSIYEAKINVLDSRKKLLRCLGQANYVGRKDFPTLANNLLGALSFTTPKSMVDTMKWDGKLYNNITGKYEFATDGKYYIQVETKIAKKSKTIAINMPIIIDTCRPVEVDNRLETTGTGKTLNLTVADNTGLEDTIYLYVDGEVTSYDLETPYGSKETTCTLDLTGIQATDVYYMISDVAGNFLMEKIEMNENVE